MVGIGVFEQDRSFKNCGLNKPLWYARGEWGNHNSYKKVKGIFLGNEVKNSWWNLGKY